MALTFKHAALALSSVALVTGCANTSSQLAPSVDRTVQREIQQVAETQPAKPAAVVTDHEGAYLAVRPVAAATRGDVTLRASSAPFGPMVSELARQHGYSVVFADNVNVMRKVTAEFSEQTPEAVIRGMARLAGYAVALDKTRRTFTIAERATYTFKLPSSLFQAVGAEYTVGNSGTGNAGGQTAAGGTGPTGGGLGSTQQANFKLSGRSSPQAAQLQKLIAEQAGAGAAVSVTDIGLVTVKADALGLERVQKLVEQLSKDALTQIEVEAAVIEVALTDDFQLGIDWTRVLPRGDTVVGLGNGARLGAGVDAVTATTPAARAAAAASLMQDASLTGAFTSASIATVISNLSQYSSVKVVSRPKVVSMNNIPSTFFAGNNIPYLGNVSITAPATAGSGQTSAAEVSFAANGVSLSVVPSVLSSRHVHLTLLPSLSKVTGFSEFEVSGTRLSAPDQSSRNAYMQVTAEDGKTVIIGGMKTARDDVSTKAALGVVPTSRGSTGEATELVILLKPRIIPAPVVDVVVSESI